MVEENVSDEKSKTGKNGQATRGFEEVNTEGGAYIAGNISTGGGDFVGRDKTISGSGRSVVVGGSFTNSTIVTGDGNTVNNTRAIFAPVYSAIQNSSRPVQEKEDLTADVHEVEDEVQKGERINESFLVRRLRNLKRMAPDIGDLLLSVLGGPGAVVGTVVKKITEKIKSEA